MPEHEKIDYLEWPSENLEQTRQFFETVFGWQFQSYGPDYMAFARSAGLEGGFYRAPLESRTDKGAVLVVLYSDHLESTREKVLAAGGEEIKPIFSFPGGRRFHFAEPGGNELAVWSEK